VVDSIHFHEQNISVYSIQELSIVYSFSLLFSVNCLLSFTVSMFTVYCLLSTLYTVCFLLSTACYLLSAVQGGQWANALFENELLLFFAFKKERMVIHTFSLVFAHLLFTQEPLSNYSFGRSFQKSDKKSDRLIALLKRATKKRSLNQSFKKSD